VHTKMEKEKTDTLGGISVDVEEEKGKKPLPATDADAKPPAFVGRERMISPPCVL